MAMAENVVYAVNASSELLALDASNGTKIWGYPANMNTTPAVSKSIVYAGSTGGGIVALRTSDGKPTWDVTTYFTAGPVVGVNAVYIADISKVYALQI